MALAGIPPCSAPSTHATAVERVGLVENAVWVWLRAYQVVVSPADGAGCGMYPSCSRYAMGAVRAHGPVKGFFAASARLFAHHKDPHLPVCQAGDRLYVVDPPEDFWGPR